MSESKEIEIHCRFDELVPINKLKDHPKNRNKHPRDQLERLAKLYSYHGIRHPVIVSNLSGFVVAGCGRKDAGKIAGMATFPVVFQDFESEEAEYAFMQADNAIALWSEIDLSGINTDLPDLGPDFDIDMLGIRDFVIEPADKLEPQCDEDEIPEKVEPRTKLGDLYKLGNHRLLCGDSTSIDAVERLMGGQKADMIFTDPPYGVDYEGINNDSRSGLADLLDQSFSNYALASRPGSGVYVFHSDRCADIFHEAFRRYFHFSSMVIWVKPALVLSQTDYQSKHEPMMYGWVDGGTHTFYGDRKQTSVWEFGKESVTGHTTPKPVELVSKAIELSSKPGGSVIDLFGGSGSTLIACEKTARSCYMMELDPHYCDVIVSRWEVFSGKKAELLNGTTEI